MPIKDNQSITKANIKEFQQFRANIGLQAVQKGLTEDKLQDLLKSD